MDCTYLFCTVSDIIVGAVLARFCFRYSPLLKCLLLHNGNQYLYQVGTVDTKDNYENVKYLLGTIDYNIHKWLVYELIKMTLMRLCKIFLLSLPVWQSCYISLLPQHTVASEGTQCYVPTLGVIRERSYCFTAYQTWVCQTLCESTGKKANLSNTFPICFHIYQKQNSKVVCSPGKRFAGCFSDTNLKREKTTLKERHAWRLFREVVEHFLGNNKSGKYEQLKENLITTYKKLG